MRGGDLPSTDDPIENARRFCVRMWMGFGAKTSDISGWKNSKQGNGPNMPRLWNRLPEQATAVAERLKNAQIECRPAIDLIRQYNYEDCLIYADPPYLLNTRSKRMYRHEMDYYDHVLLLMALKEHKGSVVISGYDNDLYNDYLEEWEKHQIDTRAENSTPRTETIWIKK